MNNTQLYLSIGIPTLTVILAWLSNRSDLNRLNDKVDRLGDTLHGKIDRQGESLRAELAALRIDHHKDNVALMGYMVPLHERMAKLESRS
jgi:hypothetical protein